MNKSIDKKTIDEQVIKFLQIFSTLSREDRYKPDLPYLEEHSNIFIFDTVNILYFIRRSLQDNNIDESILININSLVWMLVAQGKITPINSEHGLFNYKLGLVKFTITEEGRNWLNNYIFYEGRNVTNSLDAYYERLNQQKITLGEISNSYLVEAINCYFNNCPRASMVMLGVALEALFDELDESIKSTSIPEWKSLESNSKDRSYSKRLKRFSAFIDDKVKIIEQITGVENPKIFLAPMFEHIRQIRNDGAHAALPNHDLTEAYAMLELFIRVAKIISKLRDYLKYSSIL